MNFHQHLNLIDVMMSFVILDNEGCCCNPTFEGSVRSPLTLPKMGLGSPPGLSKIQNTIAGVKTPCIKVFFILFERSQSLDVQNGFT